MGSFSAPRGASALATSKLNDRLNNCSALARIACEIVAGFRDSSGADRGERHRQRRLRRVEPRSAATKRTHRQAERNALFAIFIWSKHRERRRVEMLVSVETSGEGGRVGVRIPRAD